MFWYMLPELFLILSSVEISLAQTTSATCYSDFSWAFNNQQQSPCLVAAFLGHQCSPGSSYNVPPLSSGQRYLPPSGQQANLCQCSSVFYSLLSACAQCQGSSLATFTDWTSGCIQGNISVETYPMATPTGTLIPPWTFLPLSNGAFDVLSAGKNATGNPNFGQSSGSLSTAAIIGLTVGCVIALLLFTIALWLYLRMRTQQRIYAESKQQQSTTSASPAIRYGKIEGPPRKPRAFLGGSTGKVVSYRPGLNFDLDKGRRGDLLELSESSKLTKSQASSNEPSVESISAFASKTSFDSSAWHSKRPEHHSEPGTSHPITNLFSRAKEVKPQRGEARLDLTEPGDGGIPAKPFSSNSDLGGEHYQDTSPRHSGGRRPGILDM